MSDANTLLVWMIGGGIVVAAVVMGLVWARGRRLPGEHVFRASRWSRGNHVFPTQVSITPTSVVHYTPEWFGKKEQSRSRPAAGPNRYGATGTESGTRSK